MNELKVSVLCTTYNHKPYIKDAIEGFLMQKCSFAFEVLIHDDASTDGTQEIIKEYAKRFPDIIKPIFQTENQFSKNNGSIIFDLQFLRAAGKYIAICEGDDCWTDPFKLQKQFDVLEKHPNLNMCACYTSLEENGKAKSFFPKEKNDILSPQKVILNGGGYLGTCSLFFRKDFHDKYYEIRKKYRIDYCLQILGSLHEGIYLIREPMCIYRRGVEGSWTKRIFSNEKRRLEHDHFIIDMLNDLDNESNNKYHRCFEYAIDQFLMDVSMISGTKKESKRLSKKFISNYYEKEKKLYPFKIRFKNWIKYVLYTFGIYIRKKR